MATKQLTTTASLEAQLSRRELLASAGALWVARLGWIGAGSGGGAWLSSLAGCSTASSQSGATAVCTTPFLGDLLGTLAEGTGLSVKSLMGPGVDPHLYRPTAAAVADLMSARVVFVVGLGLEGKMGEVLGRAAAEGRTVIAVADAIPHEELVAAAQEEGDAAHAWDPHVWMDPALWSLCCQRAAEGVLAAAAIPAGQANAVDASLTLSSLVSAHASAYAQQLQSLRAWGIERASTIPQEQRVIITSHDAFHYFGRAFGFEVHGIQGVSTESEAGIDDVRRLINLIVERKIKAVFAESSVADKSVQALIEGAAARGQEVRLGGTLYADSLGDPGTYEGTYLGMIDHDITTIVTALGGEVDSRGWQGRLASAAMGERT